MAAELSFEQKKEKRAKFHRDEDKAMWDAYGKLMQLDNQLFEDRMLLIHRAREFEAGDKRKEFAQRLQKLGLTPDEAQDMSFKAPRFDNEAYNNPDNFKLSPELEKFGEEFDKEYHWKHYAFPLSTRMIAGNPKPYLFKELHLTEKLEYLQLAFHYIEGRQQFYKPRWGTIHSETGGTVYFDEYDRNKPIPDSRSVLNLWHTKYEKGHTEASETPGGGEISWEAEHALISKWNGDTIKRPTLLNLSEYVDHGNGLGDSESKFSAQHRNIGEYRSALDVAEKTIDGALVKHTEHVNLMQKSYALINSHSMAVTKTIVDKPPFKDSSAIILRDLAAVDPDKRVAGDTRQYTCVGHYQQDTGNIMVSELFDTLTGENIPLAAPIHCNINTRENFDKLREIMNMHRANGFKAGTPTENIYTKTPDARLEIGAASDHHITPDSVGVLPEFKKMLQNNATTVIPVIDRTLNNGSMVLLHVEKSRPSTHYNVVGFEIKPDKDTVGEYVAFPPEKLGMYRVDINKKSDFLTIFEKEIIPYSKEKNNVKLFQRAALPAAAAKNPLDGILDQVDTSEYFDLAARQTPAIEKTKIKSNQANA